MAYEGIDLELSLEINKIYSIHYFEYMSDFTFEGESHDFWEFICVDKGQVGIQAGKLSFILKKGEIAFHEPNEFHNVKATDGIAPNLVVISFKCDNLAMQFFRKKVLNIDNVERNILANIITESKRCFDCRLDDPYLENMPVKKSDIFASQQMIKLYLEFFLIHLIRRYTYTFNLQRITTSEKVFYDAPEIYERIIQYMDENICSQLSIKKICQENLISRTQLQKIFKQKHNLGVIEYFLTMKINLAKEMIRTKHMSLTQIAESLGYSSIHYFSRQFKKISGMSPSEYATSIKAMSDRSFN